MLYVMWKSGWKKPQVINIFFIVTVNCWHTTYTLDIFFGPIENYAIHSPVIYI